ncbi:hypothetical protein IC620_15390 [Hazenella sp. IB182357]|uniref:PBSX phage terminase small subunit-like N-terminal domain-containing protein n=1 Tax=Polycladospora coralii TaxID=2771432 RepID=A0A926N6Z9_9BACL|nr:hypothetical protein [Polycladospora coralii]
MARSRSPNRDRAREIWEESNGSIKLKEIADQLGVSDSQIRKWKNNDQWCAPKTLPNTEPKPPMRKVVFFYLEIEEGGEYNR